MNKELEDIVKSLRPIDDPLYEVLMKRKEVMQEVLSAVFHENITVLNVNVQKKYEKGKYCVYVDSLCRLSDKREIIIYSKKVGFTISYTKENEQVILEFDAKPNELMEIYYTKQKYKAAVNNIETLMKNRNLTLEETCSLFDETVEDYDLMIDFLNKHPDEMTN